MAALNDDCVTEIQRKFRNKLVWKNAAVSQQWLRAAKRVLLERRAMLELCEMSLDSLGSYAWCPHLSLGTIPLREKTLARWEVRSLKLRDIHGVKPEYLPKTLTEITLSGGVSADILETPLAALLERLSVVRILVSDSTFELCVPHVAAGKLEEFTCNALGVSHVMSWLETATRLQKLHLNMIDHGIPALPASLTDLKLDRIFCDSDALTMLRPLTNLRKLHLGVVYRGISIANHWEALAMLTQLEELTWYGAHCGHAPITLPRLTRLKTDEMGADIIAPRLQELSFPWVPYETLSRMPLATVRRLTYSPTDRSQTNSLDFRRATHLEELTLSCVTADVLLCNPLRVLVLKRTIIAGPLPSAKSVLISFDMVAILGGVSFKWDSAPERLAIRTKCSGPIPEGVEVLYYEDSPVEWAAPRSCRFLEARTAPTNLADLTRLEHCHVAEGKVPALSGVCPSKTLCQLRWDD